MIRPASKTAQPREDIFFRSSDSSMSGRVPLTILLRPTFGLFLLILLMSIAQSAAAQGVKFTSPVTYPAGNPFRITSGDFNRDGKLDLVAGDVTNKNLVMLLGNGDGTFKPGVTFQLADAPYEIVPADFNRDGKLDLAISNTFSSTSIRILFGKGDGSFEQPVTYPVAGSRLVVADLNRDGWPDLVARSGILPSDSRAVVLL